MAKEATVRNQIFSAYDSLFDAEKKVADYLMNHQEKAIEMSVSELAGGCEARPGAWRSEDQLQRLSPSEDQDGEGDAGTG